MFGKLYESDTVNDKIEIIYKTKDIDGHKVFYKIQTADTSSKNQASDQIIFSFLY